MDVTGGSVTEFYAGMGGANKNGNCEEEDFNICTVAILGDMDVSFASGTVDGAYLTTGLERADSFTCNIPLTVKTMNLAAEDYEGTESTSGNFTSQNSSANWNATIVLTSTQESFTPSDSGENNITYASGAADKVVTEQEGVYTLTDVTADTDANVAQIGSVYYTSLTGAYNAAVDGRHHCAVGRLRGKSDGVQAYQNRLRRVYLWWGTYRGRGICDLGKRGRIYHKQICTCCDNNRRECYGSGNHQRQCDGFIHSSGSWNCRYHHGHAGQGVRSGVPQRD